MYRNAHLWLFLLLILNTVPALAQQSAPQRPPGRVTPLNQQNPNAHFLKQGELGFSKKVPGVPEGYPLPVPPGAVLSLADSVVTASGGNGYYVRFHAPHSRTELVHWYLVQLKSGGWNFKDPAPDGLKVGLTCSRGNCSAIVSFFEAPNGGTDIVSTASF